MSKILDNRLELYRAGLGDRAIATAIGVHRASVRDWRKRNGLPANFPSAVGIGIHRWSRYRELYDQGLTDQAIIQAVGGAHKSLYDWRVRMGLPPNDDARFTPPDAHAERERLYALGLSDSAIAAQTGVGDTAISKWRKNRNLPATHAGGGPPHTPEQRAARMFLYSLGYSDTHIAREQKVTAKTVRNWRGRLGLPAVANVTPATVRRRRFQDVALDRIRRAVGRGLPPDIAQDAIGDLYVAVLSGKVSMDDIETRARQFGNRVLDQFASKYGPRSLDEELGDEDGFRMIDMIADERSSSWLEEMGATVW